MFKLKSIDKDNEEVIIIDNGKSVIVPFKDNGYNPIYQYYLKESK